MKWFLNMKIGAKLIVSFIIVSLIAGLVGIIGIININNINKNDKILYENMTVPLSEVANMARLFQRARVNTRDLILYNNEEDIEKTYSDIMNYFSEIEGYAMSFEKTIIQDEVEVAYQTYLEALNKYMSDMNELYKLCKQNKDDEAFAYIKGVMQVTADDLRVAIDRLVDLKVSGAKKQSDDNTSLAAMSVVLMIGVIAGGMLIALVLGIVISRLISIPMRKLVMAADKIADGDLDVYIDIDTKEEIGILANAFNRMAINLNDVVSNINVAAEQVASGSKQVSASSIALSQGATEQASTIEELTASLEEISTQTKLNADNSNEASSLAKIAKDTAVQGNNHMNDMLKAMEEINLSSNSISKIIKVIDDIAFQTNILALNAAVEAARAGQHGKGFAVVAEEVRNLAARSANAAKETTEMIEDSIRNVVTGTSIAKQTSEALNKIVDDVSKVATLIGHIAAASNEQASGIAQVNQGIIQVSEVVQMNSATSEESAAASEELSSQAEILKDQALRFKLRKTGNYRMSYDETGSLNPDVIKLLDKMSEKTKSKGHNNTTEIKVNTESVLSDKEFGKY